MIQNKEPVNILMVDDQPAKLLSYETILAELGENLIRASSGNEALELLLKKDIAVVLVDVCMPELDGFELAEMIRRHPRFQKTAIILISGVLVDDSDRLRGYGSGAVDYVSVPIVPEILRAKVSVFADLYRKTEALERLNQELERRVNERTAEIQASAARLRQSRETLRLVLSAAGIKGWTWDIGTDVITWLGATGEVENSPQHSARFYASIHPNDQPVIERAFQRAVAGAGEYYAEFRVVDGEDEQWWLGRGTIITDAFGRPHSIAGININITERKRAEQERAVLLKKAEEARKEAERANQAKDQFLATLSHELRNPLNAITGWAHMLKAGSLDANTQVKAIDTIGRNATLQMQLISDILDVSRITTGKLRLEIKPVDIRAVVHSAIDAMRPSADAKNIRIDAYLRDVVGIAADQARLQQVICNILSNSVKFSPQNSSVLLSVESGGDNLVFTVEDNGPGIQPDFLPFVFERFRQADSSSTRSYQGLGLGLAIARHLVEMHGGHIEALNRQGRSGAIIRFSLPLRAAAQTASEASPAGERELWLESAPSLDGILALVVDDSEDAREVVAEILRRCGAEVQTSASAGEAFELVQRALPHLLIADLEMPGQDGFTLVRRIRELPPEKGGRTPAIALTGYASSQDKSKAVSAGFQSHISKPVQPPELLSTIAAVLRSGLPSKLHNSGKLTDTPPQANPPVRSSA